MDILLLYPIDIILLFLSITFFSFLFRPGEDKEKKVNIEDKKDKVKKVNIEDKKDKEDKVNKVNKEDKVNKVNKVDKEKKVNIEGFFHKRKYLSQGLRHKIWTKTYGEEFKVECDCCNLSIINPFNCVWGHILSHAEGGDTGIDNMKPICNCCNASMGKKHMNEYKKEVNH